MNYLDVYKTRVGHLGATPQTRAYSSGILEFRRYLKYNQHTQRNLHLALNEEAGTIVEDAVFDGVILTDKEDENRVSQILLTKVIEDGGPTLKPGDLVKWNDEMWIIYRTTTSSYQPHQKFYMVKCNYYIKWVDNDGLLRGSWIYLVGSKDSKIKDNFRTWHNIITPQPNKHINILMPHQIMAINTEIMVLDEVWYLVDYDQSSVPGVVFMSFTETNFNEQRDSLEDSIANVDKLATWVIDMPESRTVAANSIIDVEYTILKNGMIQNVPADISVEGNLTLMENQQIQTGADGSGTITVSCKDTEVKQLITIEAAAIPEYTLIGSEKIRMGMSNTYVLNNANAATYILEPTELATLKMKGAQCVVTANSKGKVGSFTLKASFEGKDYIKTIQVVPLWQVN